MALSRWRRVVTGVAAGVIVLCAALVGASFRGDGNTVSVASDTRPAATVIPVEDVVDATPIPLDTQDSDAAADADDDSTVDTGDAEDTGEAGDSDAGDTGAVTVIEPESIEDATDSDSGDGETGDTDTGDGETGDTDTDDEDLGTGGGTDDGAAGDSTTDETATDQAPAPTVAPAGPLTGVDDTLGTGGGVDDAECALDRLVIYAGARRSGVARSIRAALTQAGFAASCPTPVTVLASNCPLQFAGRLGPGADYDPLGSFVASSAAVDRETMTAVMSSVGYSGSQIDILDFGFVNPDRPGEQWVAIFIPPTFAGWEGLAQRAGLTGTTTSLCGPSGTYQG